jgi:hypothetical protein
MSAVLSETRSFVVSTMDDLMERCRGLATNASRSSGMRGEVGDVLKERIHVLFVDGATTTKPDVPLLQSLEVDPGDALGGACVVAVVSAVAERRKKKWYPARPFVHGGV